MIDSKFRSNNIPYTDTTPENEQSQQINRINKTTQFTVDLTEQSHVHYY